MEKNKYYLKPISPLARVLLFKSYMNLIRDLSLQHEFDVFINSPTVIENPRVLGYFIEDHIKLLLSLGQLTNLDVETYESSGKHHTTLLQLNDINIINFAGFLAPCNDFDKNKDTLFLPMEKTYAGFDFIVYKAQFNAILFMNVTIMMDAEKHIFQNDQNVLSPSSTGINLNMVMTVSF